MQINLRKLLHVKARAGEMNRTRYGYMHVTRDWVVILGVAATFLAGGVVYSAYDFYTQFGVASEVPDEEKTIRYRGKEVLEMSEIYTKKESVFMELRASTPPIPTVTPTKEETGTTSASVATGETEGLAEMQTPEYTDSAEVHMSP